MSWQAYVDTSLVGSGHISKAAIISAAADSTWAKSTDFDLKDEEMKALRDILNKTGGAVDKAYAEGVYVAGERFVVTTLADNRSVYARKGQEGVVVVQTKQAILVGRYDKGVIAGNAAQTVENLADYLAKLGY